MAQKNIINKVKTTSGYDTLYPLTPYQIYTASSVTNSGSTYNVTIPLPTADIILPILIRFKANVNASTNPKISVNGSIATAIMGNVVGNVKQNDICVVAYDNGTSSLSSTAYCCLLNIENKVVVNQDDVGGTTTFSTNTITKTMNNGGTVVTTFNDDGSISETVSINGQTTTKTTTFNSNGSITEVIS